MCALQIVTLAITVVAFSTVGAVQTLVVAIFPPALAPEIVPGIPAFYEKKSCYFPQHFMELYFALFSQANMEATGLQGAIGHSRH